MTGCIIIILIYSHSTIPEPLAIGIREEQYTSKFFFVFQIDMLTFWFI